MDLKLTYQELFMELIEEITHCIENKKYAVRVFIDLEKSIGYH